MRSKGKKVTGKSAARPEAPKKARPGEKPSDDPDGHASWRFESVDFDYPTGGNWSNLDGTTLREIVETLQHCESMPIRQWIQQPRGKGGVVFYGPDHINRFCDNARTRLADLQLGDLDEVVRIWTDGSTKRMYAWRGNGNVFNLIWWDPVHEAYPTAPRS